MIINWYKYIREMLPPRLRLTGLVEMLRVLVFQIPKTGSDFDLSLAQLKYKTNVNASTIALEKLIETELDALADIEELDGKPFDFLVNVHSQVDEILLKTLINQHKIAGKTFVFKLGSVAYAANFINYECEDIIELYTAEFADYVCEQDSNNKISLFIGTTINGKVSVTAQAQQPVKSEILIEGSVVGYNDMNQMLVVGEFIIIIPNGDISDSFDISMNPDALSYEISSGGVFVSPSSDEYFNYIIV